MALNLDQNEWMSSIVSMVKAEQNAVIERMLQVGLDKGIIKVRQSEPVLYLVNSPDSSQPKLKLEHSCVIDYLGNEKIEELEAKIAEQEKAIEYLKKINSEIHNALSEFYERTKVNTWLKNQS